MKNKILKYIEIFLTIVVVFSVITMMVQFNSEYSTVEEILRVQLEIIVSGIVMISGILMIFGIEVMKKLSN